MLEIKGIFTLSDVQYEAYKHIIPSVPERWWLQTAASDSNTLVKTINNYGDEVLFPCTNETVYVRPALIINGPMPVGCIVEFAGVKWTVVSSIYKTVVAVCNNVIAQRQFDFNSNEWETSELKAWLEEWVEYICLGSDDVIYDTEYSY